MTNTVMVYNPRMSIKGTVVVRQVHGPTDEQTGLDSETTLVIFRAYYM